MPNKNRFKCLFIIAATITIALFVLPEMAITSEKSCKNENILSIDYAVPHVSTAPGNYGEDVVLFLRERVKAGDDSKFIGGKIGKSSRVVLFVHGGSITSVPDYDLPFKDYSWAEYLVKAGFDVFMMDQTTYGFSPRPNMTDPCNVNPAQHYLIEANLPEGDCTPTETDFLTTLQSDWDEIDSVVDFIRDLRGVDRVNLIGWSLGTARIGGYAADHPEKVDKLYFYAGFVSLAAPNPPPPGYSISLQSYDALMYDRWGANVSPECPGQIDPDIQPVIWNTVMSFDPLGSTWGSPPWNPIATPDGGMMRLGSKTYWRWTAEKAGMVHAPSLLIVGEQDSIKPSHLMLFDSLGTNYKVNITVDCATHFLTWEYQYQILHETSKEWFLHGSIKGVKSGTFHVDPNGKIHKE